MKWQIWKSVGGGETSTIPADHPQRIFFTTDVDGEAMQMLHEFEAEDGNEAYAYAHQYLWG